MKLAPKSQTGKRSGLTLLSTHLKALPPAEGFAEAQISAATTTTAKPEEIKSSSSLEGKAVSKRVILRGNVQKGHCKRTRDHLLEWGPAGISDCELLELLLSIGKSKIHAEALSSKLLNRFGSFGKVLNAQPRLLAKVPGIRPHSIAALKLVHAAAVRLARSEVMDRPMLGNWDALMGYLNAVLAREPVEQLRVLFLDVKCNLIADELLWRGTINHTPGYPREVVKRALELESASIVLAHNHPSGDPTPSHDDIVTTQQVIAAARTLSIEVHDHVIVGNGTWVSFRKEGLL
jgi:DNA repair protein RadC